MANLKELNAAWEGDNQNENINGVIISDIKHATVPVAGVPTDIASFTVSTDTSAKNDPSTLYKIQLWGEDAKKANGLNKLDYVKVEGKPQLQRYEYNGETRTQQVVNTKDIDAFKGMKDVYVNLIPNKNNNLYEIRPNPLTKKDELNILTVQTQEKLNGDYVNIKNGNKIGNLVAISFSTPEQINLIKSQLDSINIKDKVVRIKIDASAKKITNDKGTIYAISSIDTMKNASHSFKYGARKEYDQAVDNIEKKETAQKTAKTKESKKQTKTNKGQSM